MAAINDNRYNPLDDLDKKIMTLPEYRNQRIIPLASLNHGLVSEKQEEINL